MIVPAVSFLLSSRVINDVVLISESMATGYNLILLFVFILFNIVSWHSGFGSIRATFQSEFIFNCS